MDKEYIKDLPDEFYHDCPYASQAGHVFKLMGPPFEDLWVKMLCSRPWCLPCGDIRIWRMRLKIHKYLKYHNKKNLWLWTRSVRNEGRLVDAFRTLHECNQRFNTEVKDRPEHAYHKVETSIGTYEITYNYYRGYNLHQHIILGSDVDRIEYGYLRQKWNEAAGYKAVGDFVKIKFGGVAAGNYLVKYISKGIWGGLTPERAYLVKDTLFRRNRITTKRGTAPPLTTKGYCFCCHAIEGDCVRGLYIPGGINL